MSELVWLVGIPLGLIGITIWQPSLLTLVPTFLGIYITFIVGLFTAPFSTVAIVWLAFAIAVLPFLFYKFPGQYTVASSLTTLFLWPVLAAITAVAERQVIRIVEPADVPKSFNATVTYIDTPGTDADYLMVFLDAFDETAFFCDVALESEYGLAEDVTYAFQIEVKSVDELGDNVLWIKAIDPVAE